MKKIALLLIVLTSSLCINAIDVKVLLRSNHTIKGELILRNDTTLIIAPSYANTQELKLDPVHVDRFTISGVGIFLSQDGKFVPTKQAKSKIEYIQTINSGESNNVNIQLGKALKSSGDVALGIGVPCLAAGLACVIAGHTMPVRGVNSLSTDAKVREAGYYLLPIGASLTIIGIPLHIHGKKIMEMNINYTGNGAGLAFKF